MNQNDGHQKNQEKLDAYQVKWVLGKQRGEEAPLEAIQLKALIEAGRFPVSVVSEKENEDLKAIGFLVNVPKKNQIRPYEFAELLVDGLFGLLKKDFADYIQEKNWESLNELEQNEMKQHLFKLKYGVYPHYLATQILIGSQKGDHGG